MDNYVAEPPQRFDRYQIASQKLFEIDRTTPCLVPFENDGVLPMKPPIYVISDRAFIYDFISYALDLK